MPHHQGRGGELFRGRAAPGSQAHDELEPRASASPTAQTARGIDSITTGQPVLRAAMRPLATLMKPDSVDLRTMKPAKAHVER